MDPLVGAAVVSVLVAVFLGVMAIYQTGLFSGGRIARERLQSLVAGSASEGSTLVAPLREESLSALPALRSLLTGKEWTDKVALDLDRADLRLRVGEYVAIRVILAMFLAVMAVVLVSALPAALLLAVVLAVIGYKLPAFWVERRKKRRVQKLESQLEEALTMTSNSLKAGFGLLQSLELAADQLKHPISTELRRTIRDINVGSSTEDALLALNERASSYDLDIVITAVLIQRSVGGNLAEILENVAHTMRERARIRGEIRALTSQQRLTGYILGGMPVAVIGILFLISRDYMTPLFTTLAGQAMLGGAAILEAIGVLLIRRILAIDV